MITYRCAFLIPDFIPCGAEALSVILCIPDFQFLPRIDGAAAAEQDAPILLKRHQVLFILAPGTNYIPANTGEFVIMTH